MTDATKWYKLEVYVREYWIQQNIVASVINESHETDVNRA